jgi:endonuclease YncB( thermonuclease family)
MACVALLGLLGWSAEPGRAWAASIEPSAIRVLDGDTIRINRKRPDIQLVGFNAPEVRGAKCADELTVGGQATRRLRSLVKAGSLDFEPVACNCPRGTKEGTRACNYGRRCGVLKAGGRDVGEILIEERLAVSFKCGETGCPPAPRPWCSDRRPGSR